jgi:hypothetical protein
VEKCIYCESAYVLEDSFAEKPKAYCSITCEERYDEFSKNSLKIIE